MLNTFQYCQTIHECIDRYNLLKDESTAMDLIARIEEIIQEYKDGGDLL